MKIKIIVLYLFLVLSIFVTQKVEAVSGACSYHGGVDCGAGPDYDGSVICNDGWRDSSVGYYGTSMCRSSDIPLCVYPVGIGCTDESSYNSMRAMWARSGYPDTMLSNLQECRNQIDEYNRLKAEYDSCLYRMMNPTPYPTPILTPLPTATPYYDPCPEGWINLKSLNLCIKPATPTPIPLVTPTPTPTELFKDLFKNYSSTPAPKPKVTPKVTLTPKIRPTMSPSINPEPTATIEARKEALVSNNNTLTRVFNLFKKIKFW
ncbi:MAG: hypothetical protein UW14_C0003G0016 [Candidatus Yanofskybacteria bacterium GW2011_GWA2_44_10]|nr:MAG: hypothetical protein UW14_C0003G0016 [Candidatus Yanofskybacteria bacterium GW2011_GWA2_44_10]